MTGDRDDTEDASADGSLCPGGPVSHPHVVRQPDGSVIPADGYRWCPYCNGEGFVMTMEANPNLDETCSECGFCEDGIVVSPSSPPPRSVWP